MRILMLASLMWLGACATPALEVGKDALRPPPRVVSYELEVHPGYAVVRMSLRQPGGDPIELSMPQWQSANLSQDVYDVHARVQASGEHLEVSRPSPDRWMVEGFGGQDFIVRYVVVGHRGALTPTEGQPDTEVSTFTGETQFLGWGRGLFLIPTLPEGAPAWDDIRLETRSSEPGWTMRTSWGRASNSFPSFEKLRAGLVLGGAWQTDETQLRGSYMQVSITGEWSNKPQEIQRLVRKLLRVQAEIFAGYPSNAGLMAIVPASSSRARVLASPGAAVFYLPREVSPDGDAALVKALALEHFKIWSGQIFAPRLDESPGSLYREGHAKWFTEGLTEYYAVRTMMAMGVISVKDFVPLLNGWIKDYYGNPYAFNTPRAVLLAGYKDTPAFQRLARIKGALLGLILDVELRAGSQGLRSLDQIMQKMSRQFADKRGGYTSDDVQRMLGELTGASWEDFFASYIDGVEVLPLADLSRGGIIVLELSFPIYDLGFRTAGGALVNAPVTSVTPGSEAEGAGVREGDIVRALEMEEGRVDKPVRVTLERVGVKRAIKVKYLPTRDVDMPLATEMTGLFEDWFAP